MEVWDAAEAAENHGATAAQLSPLHAQATHDPGTAPAVPVHAQDQTTPRLMGVVRAVFTERGYGFIEAEGYADDLFFRIPRGKPAGLDVVGTSVSFLVREGGGRQRAEQVRTVAAPAGAPPATSNQALCKGLSSPSSQSPELRGQQEGRTGLEKYSVMPDVAAREVEDTKRRGILDWVTWLIANQPDERLARGEVTLPKVGVCLEELSTRVAQQVPGYELLSACQQEAIEDDVLDEKTLLNMPAKALPLIMSCCERQQAALRVDSAQFRGYWGSDLDWARCGGADDDVPGVWQ